MSGMRISVCPLPPEGVLPGPPSTIDITRLDMAVFVFPNGGDTTRALALLQDLGTVLGYETQVLLPTFGADGVTPEMSVGWKPRKEG